MHHDDDDDTVVNFDSLTWDWDKMGLGRVLNKFHSTKKSFIESLPYLNMSRNLVQTKRKYDI